MGLATLVDIALRRVPAEAKLKGVAGPGRVLLSVEDSGPGIPPDERERVFSRFYRVPGSQAGGSGLGLAIIKSIAERHGAVLTLDTSERLGGLKINIDFPETARPTPV